MKNWQIFELECFNYLNKNFSNNYIEFEYLGSSDSTVSDISVIKNNHKVFTIEVKMPKSQSGQFVLSPNFKTNTFIYSKKNKTKINRYSNNIIKYMNKNFSFYSDTKRNSKKINLDSNLFANWIISYYKTKSVKYIITQNHNGSFIILPLSKISDYFDISAVYRIKKSGSANPSRANLQEIKELLKINNIDINKLEFNNKKLYLYTNSEVHNHSKFSSDKYDYLFNKISRNIFNVRRLSRTYNSNVIFSLELIKEQDENDFNNFINDLEI